MYLTVKDNEKVLLYKNEKFDRVLETGRHLLPLWMPYRTERYDLTTFGIGPQRSEILAKRYPEQVKKHFTVVSLAEHERAYIHVDGKFAELLDAGVTKLYWKELDLSIERVDVREHFLVAPGHGKWLQQLADRRKIGALTEVVILPHEEGHLIVDQQYRGKVGAGRWFYYTDRYTVSIHKIDTRIKSLEIFGQELLSRDKVTLRCNVTLHYRVTDGERYLTTVEEAEAYLYKSLQFAVREHVGALGVDAILEKQHALSDDILDVFTDTCQALGVEVAGIHLKDIILPGEMREIFNQVIEATKRAEANIIKRREETAATRSQLNTAKLMRENPMLARLMELDALEKITQNVQTLNVYGGLEGVMKSLVSLETSEQL